MSIESVIEHLNRDWSQPKRPCSSDLSSDDFELVCRFSKRSCTVEQIHRAIGEVPNGLSEFWKLVQWAELFKDEEYGPWGLRLMAPEEAVIESARYREERADDYRNGDLIIGEFFGDADLLLVRADEGATDYGVVQVALPIEARSEWPNVGSSFEEFLDVVFPCLSFWSVSLNSPSTILGELHRVT